MTKSNNGESGSIILRSGTIYDGSGDESYIGDIAISGDRIIAVGVVEASGEAKEIDVSGLAIAPGFINMLSWANESLIADGRSQSDIRQGVTLEVMGEGTSMGPLNERLKAKRIDQQGDIKYDVPWNSLGQYLTYLENKGIATNIASFVGATTIRSYVLGDEDRSPNARELEEMKNLVAQAMEEGAMGVASALIYAPAFYAKADELIELAKVAAGYGGLYTSHLRSEGDSFLEALEELIQVSTQAKIPSEIYHLKAAGRANWHKMDKAIARIEEVRQQGLAISANMYMYPAAQTDLDAAMPPWVQEGGLRAWIERLKVPEIRARLKEEMSKPSRQWENGLINAGADGVIFVSFKSERLKPLIGKSLAEVATVRGVSPEEAAMDLVIEDESQVGTVYFWMSEENIEKQARLPWVSFGSDAKSQACEGVFLKSSTHPRAYGNVARFLGRYVREKAVTTWPQAIRRLSALPAKNLKLQKRGQLVKGHYADVVVFDPKRIIDHATFENPHQYSEGVVHVFVNGTQVLKDGEHTGALPGRAVWGPGKKD